MVFRITGGEVCVLPDRCLHRGGSLRRGAVVGDAIECPYHGWRWRGTDGRCVASPGVSTRTTGTLAAKPAVDRYGLIWTSLGETPAEVPDLPGLGQGRSYATYEPVDIHCEARPVVTTTRTDRGRLIQFYSPVRQGVWRVFFSVTVTEQVG